MLYLAAKTIDEYLNEADVLFDVQHSQTGLSLVGKEKGVTKFSYTISNFNDFADYTGDNFMAMRLGNEIRWRYMDPFGHFYEIAVNPNGDMEMLETNHINTGAKTFAFKTDGILKNHGNQAFFRLYLGANQFHNYGTIQMWNYHFFHDYSFNSGVLKAGEVPTGIADLRTEEMKNSTAIPYYKQNVIENYGKVISLNKLNINDGLSYTEHNESVFKDLEMTGGDIVVNGRPGNDRRRYCGEWKFLG